MESAPEKRLDRRTRTARAERRDPRRCFLAAAERVFAERGYAAATIEEIASEAGFSKGAVYRHFAGKEELFLALLDERIDARLRETIELTAAASPEIDMAPAASRGMVDLLADERDLVLLWHEFWSVAVRDPRLRRRYAERDRALREALARALEARAKTLGAPPLPMDATDAATAFLALAGGLARVRLIDPDAVPDGLYGEVLALVYEGLVARAGRAAGD